MIGPIATGLEGDRNPSLDPGYRVFPNGSSPGASNGSQPGCRDCRRSSCPRNWLQRQRNG